MANDQHEDLEAAAADADQLVWASVRAEMTARLVARIGTIVSYVGAVGVIVWGFLTYLAWDRFSSFGGGQGPDWKTRASALLSPISVLLLGALVIAVGSLCRGASNWMTLKVVEDYLTEDLDTDEEPPPTPV